MKGMSTLKTLAIFVFWSPFLLTEMSGQVVINEINLVTGPESGQFVELFGPPNTPLTGHSLVMVKSVLSEGDFGAAVEAVVDLESQLAELVPGIRWRRSALHVQSMR